MVKVVGLNKTYGKHCVLNDVNLDLPDRGVVAIVGPSGCGKTTLLNSLAGIDQIYSGEIYFEGVNLSKLTKKEILDYRIRNVGYVFQFFNLIPLETGERNVALVLDGITNISKSFRRRKIKRLFQIFNIEYLRKRKVINMSGGEKQRIAILRAVVNSPKMILCDEPTGALDETNSIQIMQILRQIAVNSLVVIVSHDQKLVEKFADLIIFMKDGAVVKEEINKLGEAAIAPIESSGKQLKHARIPSSFKARYSVQKMKSKKIRTVISNIMLSLSLTGIGASFLLTNTVTNKINEAFSNLTNGNQIVVRLKNESLNSYGDVFGAPEKEVQKIAEKYKEEIKGIGVNYLVNFEDFFKDRNEVCFLANGKRYPLKGYSVRNFNEYKWYDRSIPTYPYFANLTKDDVVLGITFEDMSNLCYEFKIQRSFYSLGQFLTKTNCQLNLIVENGDWEYEDQQIFNIVGVVQTNHPLLYHSNRLWNEYVFEEHMRFPSIEGGEQYAVWEMTKNYYIEANESIEELENKLFFDADYRNFVFQKSDNELNSVLCRSTVKCRENRLYVYYSDIRSIQTTDVLYLSEFYPDLKKYYFTSDYGYSSYASNILNGFSKNLFVSLDNDKLDDAIDADTSLGAKDDVSIDLPFGISGGNYLQSLDGSIKFSTFFKKLAFGREPKNDSEIVISTGLANKLSEESVLGKHLEFAAVKNEFININNQLEKTYSKTSAVIVGIVEEKQDYLYHNNLWTISFFRDKLNINPFSLIPNGVVFELDENANAEKLIINISRMFPLYSVSSPQTEIIASVSNVLSYAKTILLSFSIISLVISFLFLGTMVLLTVNESKQEIKMFNYLGFNKGQIRSLFRSQTLIRCLLAFLISSVELVVIENLISAALNKTLHVSSLSFHVTLWPLLVVLICSTIVPLLITQVILVVISKRKMIE